MMLAAACLLAGCGDGEPDAPAAPGENEYVRYCATCHGRDGAGRPPTFPPLAGSEWLDMGPESVALVVLLGLRGEIEVAGRTYRGYMPHMRQADDAEIEALLGFIASQWADWSEWPDAARIAELRARTEGREMLEGRAGLEAAMEELAP